MYGAIHWSIGNLPMSSSSKKKNDSPFPTSQLPTALPYGIGDTYLPHLCCHFDWLYFIQLLSIGERVSMACPAQLTSMASSKRRSPGKLYL